MHQNYLYTLMLATALISFHCYVLCEEAIAGMDGLGKIERIFRLRLGSSEAEQAGAGWKL